MDCLLDVHSLIWFFNGDKKLSKQARLIIESDRNKKFVSIASIWEISIKLGLKKLQFDGNTQEIAKLIEINGFVILTITIPHLIEYERLEFIHRDPFDRILVSQAIENNLVIITLDPNIKKYKVKTQW